MPVYRVTIRHGEMRYRYHVEDVDAPDMREALRLAMAGMPDEALHADIAEVRLLREPDQRNMAPE